MKAKMAKAAKTAKTGKSGKTGTFLGIPYDWRAPTWAVIKERMWNPQDRRLFTPHVFGWGWSLNLYEVLRRARLVDRR